MSSIEITNQGLRLLVTEAEEGIQRWYASRKAEELAKAEPKYNNWRRFLQRVLRYSILDGKPRLLTQEEIFSRENGHGHYLGLSFTFTPMYYILYALGEEKRLIARVKTALSLNPFASVSIDLEELQTLKSCANLSSTNQRSES